MKIFILLAMVFLHIFDDFYLQGPLAKLKQRSWWQENYPDALYCNDWKIALVEHAFSWTFMMMLPLMLRIIIIGDYSQVYLYAGMFAANVGIHAYVDHLKANKKTASLVSDQVMHIAQVVWTWLTMVVV